MVIDPKDHVSIDPISFGTDGWRAIIDEDFNPRSVTRVSEAAAKVFKRVQCAKQAPVADAPRAGAVGADAPAAVGTAAAVDAEGATVGTAGASSVADAPATDKSAVGANTILIGYDCRRSAGKYAVLVATVLANCGFNVLISDRYCPTPALCWTIAHHPELIGGVMLTSSHNPAEYLGIKLRMSDGGASPKQFTDEVEACLKDELPECFDEAIANFIAAQNGTPENPATAIDSAPYLQFFNIMDDYLRALKSSVDTELIRDRNLSIVLDPMFGAGRGYLLGLYQELGVEVVEVNGANDPSFNGLHPEPVMPWVKSGADKVTELGFDACLITDGDADRIGAIDDSGTYVSSHRILTLLVGHLFDKGRRGRVVRNLAGSALLKRQCERLGLELTTTPIGFKWIYEQMLKGDILIGGEESGGIGIPEHVCERDGLLMSLLLAELMAKHNKNLRELVGELLATLGNLEYSRRDLHLTSEQKEAFMTKHVIGREFDREHYSKLFAPLDDELVDLNYIDGIKFSLASDAWLLIRPSGTEPLVRVYAEAESNTQVEALLDIGCHLAQS